MGIQSACDSGFIRYRMEMQSICGSGFIREEARANNNDFDPQWKTFLPVSTRPLFFID
jgi:hypothetical protein